MPLPLSDPPLQHVRVAERVETEQRRIRNRALWQQADELASAHLHPALGGRLADARDHLGQLCLLGVDHIDRHLHHTAGREK